MRSLILLAATALLVGSGGRSSAQEQLKEFNIRHMRPDDYKVPLSKPVSDNTPGDAGRLSLVALPDDEVPFGRGYRGMRVLVVNRTGEQAAFLGIDERLKLLVQEALDENGVWRVIEDECSGGGCAFGMRSQRLQPGQYWELAAPRYTGSFKTKLRFRLRVLSPPYGGVFSQEFDGSINAEQFVPPPRAAQEEAKP